MTISRNAAKSRDISRTLDVTTSSMIELLAANYFRKKAPSEMFDRVLIKP